MYPCPALYRSMMASHCYSFSQSELNPCNGHGKCPSCLGIAHLKEDVHNPYRGACDLSKEERLHHTTRVCSSVSDHGRERGSSPDRHGHKCSCKHLCEHCHDSPHRFPFSFLFDIERLYRAFLRLPLSKQCLSHWVVDVLPHAYTEHGFPVPTGI